ncbi:hypothetical protein HWHPT5561_09520 [Petrotoga sp. HWH.PT.55.6.1]|jgi:DNA-binding PadR family transcriptional regulator|uniref:PadR family transcriptional regulator n=1 Tax=unclassified Petrotoga TaxID=2620614 RepID=UPI000CA04603|nr:MULTISPECIES: PadR family transcriptional regulator [unclassified Petrotoga]MBL5982152.1 hypothetical protein [Petrotoga sp. 8T1HF07.NaAc.6.1]PNR89787.1 PadR family transcriptional regulator [Petrotoga sp. 9T1HF07.CasAA.8.2]PNR91247.1 PadR family transcriptional regulator [Petrotoga sp. HWHPT.55.6.3]RLL84493.1 hypothetical protein BZ25_04180 [Petrotoga sp. Shatin.DS.tank11.9.2.9.3]RLL89621.1 hypothetical protein CN13_04910 [Petrotoga sp. HKA.pet.4.5]
MSAYQRGRGKGWRGKGRFLANFILLIIAENPTYGYEIANKLDEMGVETIEGIGQMGRIYRILSELEGSGYITSSWDTSKSPPVKVYTITPMGLEYLRYALEGIKMESEVLDTFIDKCEKILNRKE